MNDLDIIIEFKNTTIGYITNNKQNVLFENLNLKFYKNEFVTILGKSGIGKTTILKSIIGITDILSGEIEVKGDMSILFQDIRLFPHMNVIENVEYPLKVKKINKVEREKKADKLLKELGVYNKKYDNIKVLSGGEMQRVGIARSLIASPNILLLDAPFSSLDMKIKNNAREIIKQIKRDYNLTVIMITHDIADALLLSDRILILDNNEVLADEKIEDIGGSEVSINYFKKFKNDYEKIINVLRG